ncbi:hypothetical protein JAAARDRAFT_50630 [Jaapia argillacea MUCL 33604]|uniref:Uncharacterized protein n=1 Tax=Jaapia argillacea MUCL 33604 TaxID=933084 RepID=A0A067PCX9_9AGAM|nr:hypothetical protein JAAARDRAFT_50630 [Jaapia argillacea MUCL 33604]
MVVDSFRLLLTQTVKVEESWKVKDLLVPKDANLGEGNGGGVKREGVTEEERKAIIDRRCSAFKGPDTFFEDTILGQRPSMAPPPTPNTYPADGLVRTSQRRTSRRRYRDFIRKMKETVEAMGRRRMSLGVVGASPFKGASPMKSARKAKPRFSLLAPVFDGLRDGRESESGSEECPKENGVDVDEEKDVGEERGDGGMEVDGLLLELRCLLVLNRQPMIEPQLLPSLEPQLLPLLEPKPPPVLKHPLDPKLPPMTDPKHLPDPKPPQEHQRRVRPGWTLSNTSSFNRSLPLPHLPSSIRSSRTNMTVTPNMTGVRDMFLREREKVVRTPTQCMDDDSVELTLSQIRRDLVTSSYWHSH